MTATGLLLAAGELTPEQVTEALHEQGGPAWDKTVFRLLTGVDVAALAAGTPGKGEGTAVSLASSGWWLRNLDDVAARLAAEAGCDVLAVFACDAPALSGWHVARADGTSSRGVGEEHAWAAGVGALTGADAPIAPADLTDVAAFVHGDDPKGADLPGLFCFGLDADRPEEWVALLEVRGAVLEAGTRWRPGVDRDPDESPPARMHSVRVRREVPQPGPPRWARAIRAMAIRAAEEAARGDGWICLIPEKEESGEQPTAVRVLQLAPLADGSAMAVLHPRCGVRVLDVEDGMAAVEPV